MPKVWLGVALAALMCLGIGYGIHSATGEIPQKEQEFVVGVIGLVAVAMLTYMILWMKKAARSMKQQLQDSVQTALNRGNGQGWALVGMAFLAVAREGLESVFFLLAVFQQSPTWSMPVGAVLGLLAAVVIGALIYQGGMRLNLAKFFRWTGAFLIVVAAGLVAVGAGAFFAYSYVLAYEQDLARATTASLLTVATLGICLGFLGHNFQPAHMFMGDAGAMLLGFLMAMSAISFTGQVDPSALSRDHDDVLPALLPVLLPFATMALPLSDLVLAWIRRTARGQHPFKADKHHLHHRLVARGHSQRGVVFIMCSWGAVIAGGLVCTVLLNHPATWWAIGVFLVLLVLVTIMPVRRGTGTAKHG